MFDGAPFLDDILLDTVVVIDLSDRDRRVAENRYRTLKTHLERESSVLSPYLQDGASLIYPQGSIATGTTVLSGEKEDRFDLDAIVEIRVPFHWSPAFSLGQLELALQGFPEVREIERCTRCVQLRFAFMHLDVTILDPAKEPRPLRAGEIFHAPDGGEGRRVLANPYGFALWFREAMSENATFAKAYVERRATAGVDRLVGKAAQQDDLPDMIPARFDTQRVVALKLLKRFLKLRYARRSVRTPPTIYLALFAGQAFELEAGLCAQLEDLAARLEADLRQHIESNTRPDHRNPRWEADRINDRWPPSTADMKILADDLRHLRQALSKARTSSFDEVQAIMNELFGEQVAKRSVGMYLERANAGATASSTRIASGSGAIIGASSVAAPTIARVTRPVPDHSFHSEILKRRS